MHWGPEHHVAASTELKMLSVYAGQWMYAAEPQVVFTLLESGREADLLKLTIPEVEALVTALQACAKEAMTSA